MGFGSRVRAAVLAAGSPLVLGIDPPMPDKLSNPKLFSYWSILAELAEEERLPVKVQSAFFEARGPYGAAELSALLQTLQRKGVFTIADVKRSDIGSTMAAYTYAYLNSRSEYCADAMTTHPYFGQDVFEEMYNAVHETSRGYFVCVLTSNPGAQCFQKLNVHKPSGFEVQLIDYVGDAVDFYASKTQDDSFYGAFGAVVGATVTSDEAARMRVRMPRSVFLMPGMGAQGGKLDTIEAAWNGPGSVLIPVSRGITGELPMTGNGPAWPLWKEECRARIRIFKDWFSLLMPPCV